MGNLQNQVERAVSGEIPVAQTVIVIEEEARQFEDRIANLVREVKELRAENRELLVYKDIYDAFHNRIKNVFDAIAHAADAPVQDETECISV